MKPPVPKTEDPQSELDAPPRPELPWIRCCLILFLISGALHFPREGAAFSLENTPSFTLFGIALACGATAFLIGLKHLLVRPGAFLILFWFGSLALVGIIGILRNLEPAEILNPLVLPLLLGLGITTTHVAACAGMRAGEAVRYFLFAAGISLLWKFGAGSLAHNLEVTEMDPSLLISGLGFPIAWVSCTLILRRSQSRASLFVLALTAAAALFGIIRGLSFPLLLPAVGSAVCLVLGMKWRFFPRGKLGTTLAPAAVFIALGVAQCVINPASTSFPNLGASSGLIPMFALLGVIVLAMTLSLRSAWRNAETVMGRWAGDAPLMFLPFVAMLCLIGQSLFQNPFAEPLTAILFGCLAAMPQFFFNRAYYLRHRENEAAITPQLILSEEDLPTTWEGAFPTEA